MNIQELHTKAMEIAELAFVKKFNLLLDDARSLFEESFQYERKAAFMAKEENIGEPTISILLKSAASLAINCDKFVDAEKLICLGLSGEPPFEIAEELRNLLEEVHFQRHLQLQGISIDSSELQLVIAGNGISYGMAKSDLVLGRIDMFEKLTIRTVERKANKPFRGRGHIPNAIKTNFQPYLSVSRAASFAFTIRIGGVSEQIQLEGFEQSSQIIDDIFDNINLVNSGDFEQLKQNIPDEAYFKNFVGITKELAPDGEEINLLGLTIVRDGKQKDIQFTRRRSEIITSEFDILATSEDNKHKNIEYEGRLSFADEDRNNIRLKTDSGTKIPVNVPEGLGDIVKKYFGEQVRIRGTKIGNKAVILSDIDPI